jgi:c-di-GMP-related signal transduction protein
MATMLHANVPNARDSSQAEGGDALPRGSHERRHRPHPYRPPAVLDARGQVYGYELLHRASADNVSARVISDIVNGPGFDAVTDGKRAFLNLSADVQMWNVAGLLDPERVVLEIPASVAVTPEVLAACADLQRRGYDLALDGFAEDSPGEALLRHVRFAKLDVLAAPAALVSAQTTRLLEHGVTVIAEKVETETVRTEVKEAGCGCSRAITSAAPRPSRSRRCRPAS